jgi:hypothetical protein
MPKKSAGEDKILGRLHHSTTSTTLGQFAGDL